MGLVIFALVSIAAAVLVGGALAMGARKATPKFRCALCADLFDPAEIHVVRLAKTKAPAAVCCECWLQLHGK